MIRFAICDDDRPMAAALGEMTEALKLLHGQKFEVSLFFSGEEFCESLNRAGEAYDVVLMDIEMMGLTGVDAGKKLREDVSNDLTLLIFVSSHDNYLQDIINLNVYRFIPKPVAPGVFEAEMNDAVGRVLRQREFPQSPNLIIKSEGREQHIPKNSILYLQSDLRRIHVHTDAGTFTYYGKLADAEKKLPSLSFARPNQSYIVNFAGIKSMRAREIIMKDNTPITITDPYRDKVRQAYMRYRESDA